MGEIVLVMGFVFSNEFWQCCEIIVCMLRKFPACFKDYSFACTSNLFRNAFAFVYDGMHF